MTTKNPYFIDEPAIVSFSGGRSSGYMLYKILEAHDGVLPDDVHVTFANTGKEMPQTLDFVQACSENWNVPITWLEYDGRTKKPDSKNYDYRYKVVDYNSAARNGEPFEKVISDHGQLPNPVGRWCTGQLKVRTIHRYANDVGLQSPFLTIIGIRGDEKRRAVKIHNKVSEGQENFCPMYVDGTTRWWVSLFWKHQNFDLELPNNDGVTDWGNCDLCFLKGRGKRMSIIQAQPNLADWWINQEVKFNDQFDRQGFSYEQMQIIASDQGALFDFEEETIPCFCGD
jgi:3'-phosphoadenosine 5'-phosphosulfate sulfotransferase (PAPS reductase)/FAD synthetase